MSNTEKYYYIIGEIIEEDGPDCDMQAPMYRTTSLERAESFVQSFREGLRGFYVERDGGILNAFQVRIESSDEMSFDHAFYESIGAAFSDVPDPSDIYAKKILCYDYTAGDDSHPLCVNRYHLNWYKKCMTVASVILSKMVDPLGEFENEYDELKFGQGFLDDGYEIMPSQGWATDQIFVVTDMHTDDKDPESADIIRYGEKAAKIIEQHMQKIQPL